MSEFLRNGRVGTHIEVPGGLRLERDSEGCRLGPVGPRPGGGVVLPGAC
jgi:hypothetical protein